VRNHSTLVLNIKSGKIDFDANSTTGSHYNQVNVYHTDSHYTGKAKKFFAEVIAAMKGPKFFDHSDAMTDYFHCSHYSDMLDRFKIWAINQNPVFWENVSIVAFIIFIGFILGVN
jgi:hypothetical protein